jgi:ribonuclease HI
MKTWVQFINHLDFTRFAESAAPETIKIFEKYDPNKVRCVYIGKLQTNSKTLLAISDIPKEISVILKQYFPKRLEIFTDGAFSYGAGGFAVLCEDVVLHGKIQPFEYILDKSLVVNKTNIAPTNIRAEGIAIIIAILKFGRNIKITTDCEFWVKMCTKWLPNYNDNELAVKKNPDLLEILKIISIGVEIVYYPASHGKDNSENGRRNDIVDEYAKKAKKNINYDISIQTL